MSAITAKASRKMKKYAVLTREPRCFLGSFDFSWEQRKLGELCNITTGKLDANAMVSDGQYDFYTSGIDVFKIDVAAFEGPAITIAGNGASVGYMHLADGKFNAYQRTYVLTDFLADRQFLNVAIGNELPNKIQEEVRGSGIPYIVLNMLTDLAIPFPSHEEQYAIGVYFQQLDHLITLHQRKCANLCSPSQVVFSLLFATSTFSWEQRKFSDITFPAGEKNKDNLPLESYSITNEHGFVPQDEKFENGGTMREADKRMYYIVSPKSFAYNPARINVGSIGYQNIGKNVIVSSLYEVFKTSEDVDDRLLWHWFKSPDFQKLIMQLQEGGVRLYFYYDKLCMGEVSLPSLEEQRKIGKLFDTLDNLITLHQRECISFTGRADRLILTANKKRTTSSWEQRKLNEVVNVYDGVHQTPDYKDSGVMFLSVENISTLKSEKYISEEAFQRDYKVYPQKGDILMTRIGDVGTPNVVETTEKVAFYVSLALLKPTKINSYFLCNSIQSPLFQKGLKDRTLVTAIPQKINKDEIGKVNIILPTSSQEQQLIGEYFRNLDHLITLHQRKPFLMKWRTSDANRNQTNRLVL